NLHQQFDQRLVADDDLRVACTTRPALVAHAYRNVTDQINERPTVFDGFTIAPPAQAIHGLGRLAVARAAPVALSESAKPRVIIQHATDTARHAVIFGPAPAHIPQQPV